MNVIKYLYLSSRQAKEYKREEVVTHEQMTSQQGVSLEGPKVGISTIALHIELRQNSDSRTHHNAQLLMVYVRPK